MELMCLNKDFECVGYLPYINLQWNRRYFEEGEFSAQIRMKDYNQDALYLYTTERPETAIIEKMHTETDITGHYVQLSGRFLESMISRDIIWPKIETKGKPSKLAHTLVTKYAIGIPNLTVEDYEGGGDEEETECKYKGEDLDETTWSLLKLCGKSQAIRYDFESGSMVYKIWSGLDRTQNQNENSYAFFSDDSLNTEKITVDIDDSGHRNCALIALSDKKTLIEDVRESEDEPKRWIFIDEIDGSPEEGQSQKQYEESLRLKAREELQKWPKVVNVEATTIQQGLIYLRDYDLGDICDLVSNELGMSWEKRIIEVNEVIKEGQHIVELVFGDKIPTVNERMR